MQQKIAVTFIASVQVNSTGSGVLKFNQRHTVRGLRCPLPGTEPSRQRALHSRAGGERVHESLISRRLGKGRSSGTSDAKDDGLIMNDLKFALRQLLKNPGSPSTLRSAAAAQTRPSPRSAAPVSRDAFGSTATEDGPWPCSRSRSGSWPHGPVQRDPRRRDGPVSVPGRGRLMSVTDRVSSKARDRERPPGSSARTPQAPRHRGAGGSGLRPIIEDSKKESRRSSSRIGAWGCSRSRRRSKQHS